MIHHFSRELVSLFWYGEQGTKHVSNRINKVTGLSMVNMKDHEYSQYLNCKTFFTVPQLLAFDFYMSVRNGLISIHGKMKAINVGCKTLCALPVDGWDIGNFRATIIRPTRSRDLVIVHGSAFEITTASASAKSRITICNYDGQTLKDKIKTIMEHKTVYGQRFGDDIFWSCRTYHERRGWQRWRKKVGMIDKKSFKLLKK